jgi:ABC-type phosphate transport system substrate-binding protein
LAALSDGKATGDVEALVGKQVALLIYSVVVNKDARIDNLSSEQIQGIYQGRYTNWHQLGSPVDLPIRLVSRGASSGSRQTFESYVLKFPENTLSSNSCIDKDRDPTAPIIRCERDSTNQVLDEVSRVPGAIGYADSVQVAEYPNISGLRIDRRDPTVQYLPAGYPFWTIEYLYTDGVPTTGSVMNGYIDYISSDAARSRIHDAGYTPCVQADRRILDLCRTPR